MFHQHACEAVGEDALLEVCDWCYRRLLWLYNLPASIHHPPGDTPWLHLLLTVAQERSKKSLYHLNATALPSVRMALELCRQAFGKE